MGIANSSSFESRVRRVLDSLGRAGTEILLLAVVVAAIVAYMVPAPASSTNALSNKLTCTPVPVATFDLTVAKADWDRERLWPGSPVVSF